MKIRTKSKSKEIIQAIANHNKLYRYFVSLPLFIFFTLAAVNKLVTPIGLIIFRNIFCLAAAGYTASSLYSAYLASLYGGKIQIARRKGWVDGGSSDADFMVVATVLLGLGGLYFGYTLLTP